MIRAAECLIATAIFISSADADSVGGVLATFGVIGSWADDCAHAPEHSLQGFRVIVAATASGEPTYTTINIDNGVKTTVRSEISSANLVAPQQMKLRLRIFGGDVDGRPLPSPTTNTFEQIFEKRAGDTMQMGRNPPIPLQRCRD